MTGSASIPRRRTTGSPRVRMRSRASRVMTIHHGTMSRMAKAIGVVTM
ncbi:Uncharacterised protein [Mycobacteroides abscessus subsp. abscessus]|nr:Uncharacterised protein [Mycobacteroides abscessus subsp. abscessus]